MTSSPWCTSNRTPYSASVCLFLHFSFARSSPFFCVFPVTLGFLFITQDSLCHGVSTHLFSSNLPNSFLFSLYPGQKFWETHRPNFWPFSLFKQSHKTLENLELSQAYSGAPIQPWFLRMVLNDREQNPHYRKIWSHIFNKLLSKTFSKTES